MGAILMATPAAADRLEFWQFDEDENQLVFTTDEAVRPDVRLIFGPTRLVIDLPGIGLGPQRSPQSGDGEIREIRVGQPQAGVTRLVVELEPGFTFDPDEVEVRGRSPREWVVQLPEPEWLDGAMATDASEPIDDVQVEELPVEAEPLEAASELEAIEPTDYGFYLRLSGEAVPFEIDQTRRGRRIVLDLPNTRLTPSVDIPDDSLEPFGIEEMEITQEEVDADEPPRVRITLELEERGDWQAVETAVGDIVLQPGRQVSDRADEPVDEDEEEDAEGDPSEVAEAGDAALSVGAGELQNITFLPDRNALQLRVSGEVAYSVEQDGTAYRLRFPNTRVADIRPLILDRSSRLLSVEWEMDDSDLVVDLEVAADVRVGQPAESSTGFGLRQQGDRLITVAFERPAWIPGTPLPSVPMPEIGDRRTTVVLDPGHGGRDPGAVGIGGLQEVEVVNAVTPEVAALLSQQGVQVVLTRPDNRTLELETRVQVAERASADVFVSIHANAISMSRPDVNGIETFHSSSAGRILAAAIQDSLIEATGSPSRGVKSARFFVIRRTSMPAALVEVGFVTGADDAPRLEDPGYRRLLAQAIARGILQYIRDNR
jgi:N-acetylmuramoyl-L-alanine amidase